MAAAASNTYGAILTLVLNGFGNDAMKLARSLFEIELNILRLKNHPDDLRDFLDYHLIQQKQLYDIFTEEQKTNVPPERYQEMMAEYNRVLPRFIKDKATQIPRNEWCRDSLYFRAREAGAGYSIFTRHFTARPLPCIISTSLVSWPTSIRISTPRWLRRGITSKMHSSPQE